MPQSRIFSKNSLFDVLAVSLLFVQLFFLIANWNYYPTELDTPYHLLMGKMFADHNSITLWDSYEFAPIGRPNLYPPLEHVIVWLLYKFTHLSFMDIGRLIVVTQGFLSLFFVWFVSRKFFGSAVAVFSLVFFASNTEMWWWQTSVAPIAIITVLFLPFIYLCYKKKIFLPVVLLACGLYLHYGLSFTMISTILLATLYNARYRKEYLKNFLIIVGISVALFIPWLTHIYNFRHYFLDRSLNIGALPFFSLNIFFNEIVLNLNVGLWLFLSVGLFYCCRRLKEDFKYSLFFAGLVSYIMFLFLFKGTRFNAHTSIVSSVLAGLGFCVILDKVRLMPRAPARGILRLVLILLIFAMMFFEFHYLTPNLLKVNQENIKFMGIEKTEVFFRPTPLLNEILSSSLHAPFKRKHTVRIQHFFTEQDTNDLLDYIRGNVGKDVIILINNSALGDYITLQTGRKTDNGMYYETVSQNMIRALDKRRRQGFYISTDSKFCDLLPRSYIAKGITPVLIKRIGRYYVGYIPPLDLRTQAH